MLKGARKLGGVFKHVLFSSLPGEMIQFDKYFSDGLKPPARKTLLIFGGLEVRRYTMFLKKK